MSLKGEDWDKWYTKAKEEHICPCGKEMAAPGKVYCPNCLDRQALCQMIKRSKMTPEERQIMSHKNAERLKMKYYKAKESGLCVKCYKNAPVPGKMSCQRCLNKERERSRRRREVK